MKNLLIIFLLMGFGVRAQQNLVTDTTLTVNLLVNPNLIGVAKSVLSNIQSANDGAKNATTIANAANSNANNASTQALNALGVANGAVSVNANQGVQITGISNQVATDGVNIAKLQSDVSGLQTGVTLQPTIPVTLPFTLPASYHGRKIKITNSGTLTIPALPDGTTIDIVNASLGTVAITYLFTPLVGSLPTLAKGSAPRQLIAYSNNVVNLR